MIHDHDMYIHSYSCLDLVQPYCTLHALLPTVVWCGVLCADCMIRGRPAVAPRSPRLRDHELYNYVIMSCMIRAPRSPRGMVT